MYLVMFCTFCAALCFFSSLWRSDIQFGISIYAVNLSQNSIAVSPVSLGSDSCSNTMVRCGRMPIEDKGREIPIVYYRNAKHTKFYRSMAGKAVTSYIWLITVR